MRVLDPVVPLDQQATVLFIVLSALLGINACFHSERVAERQPVSKRLGRYPSVILRLENIDSSLANEDERLRLCKIELESRLNARRLFSDVHNDHYEKPTDLEMKWTIQEVEEPPLELLHTSISTVLRFSRIRVRFIMQLFDPTEGLIGELEVESSEFMQCDSRYHEHLRPNDALLGKVRTACRRAAIHAYDHLAKCCFR